jgi:hypothetical protein
MRNVDQFVVGVNGRVQVAVAFGALQLPLKLAVYVVPPVAPMVSVPNTLVSVIVPFAVAVDVAP